MKKNELKTGDMVITKWGQLGVVIRTEEEEYLLYQDGGLDWLGDFDDDLNYAFDPEIDDAVMQVYRGGAISFYDYDGAFYWERDPDWEAPTKEEMEEARKKKEAYLKEQREEAARQAQEREKHRNENCIGILVQGFYGNRTYTKIDRNDVKMFISGHLERSWWTPEKEAEVDLRMIRVPETENLVVVYDQNKEDRAVAPPVHPSSSYFTPWIPCEIPELGITLHSRCFGCRVDENGVLQSLEKGDVEILVKYFKP